jgi:hypothetical protein
MSDYGIGMDTGSDSTASGAGAGGDLQEIDYGGGQILALITLVMLVVNIHSMTSLTTPAMMEHMMIPVQ